MYGMGDGFIPFKSKRRMLRVYRAINAKKAQAFFVLYIEPVALGQGVCRWSKPPENRGPVAGALARRTRCAGTETDTIYLFL